MDMLSPHGHGTLIQTRSLVLKSGGCISPPFLHPAAMLWVCCEECHEFKTFFSSALHGQRVNIVMCSDEVPPGEALLAYNPKKRWLLYWSFLDFGPAAIFNEDAWFTRLVMGSQMAANIAPGLGMKDKMERKNASERASEHFFSQTLLLPW